jgi:hypothetical protein
MCRKNQPWKLAPEQSPCTHLAGFQGNIKGAMVEVFGPEKIRGGGYRLHFGMCSYILELFRKVVRPGDYPLIYHYNGTNGNFSLFISGIGLLQGLLHKITIIQH